MNERERRARALGAAELDDALAHWPLAPLPDRFVARTMARVRAEPRFRLSVLDAAVAAVAAVLLALACTAAGGVLDSPGHPLRRASLLAAGRFWLAIRPEDPRLTWTILGVTALAAGAVAAAAWIGRPAPSWSARR